MAEWYPGAVRRQVSGEAKDPPIEPVGVILHVAATETTSLFQYFNGPSGGIESHLFIPYEDDRPDEQYRRLTHEADANFRGNSWLSGGRRLGYHSVETEGLGTGGASKGRWTPHQVDRIVSFLRWDAAEFDFPIRAATSVFSGGVGWHVQSGAGPRTTSWSNAKGKQCPGSGRIAQVEDLIRAAASRAPRTVIDLTAGASAAKAAAVVARLHPHASVRPAVPAVRATPHLTEGRSDMVVLNVAGEDTRYCWEGPGRISAFRNPLEVDIAHLNGAPTRELTVAQARSIGVPLRVAVP